MLGSFCLASRRYVSQQQETEVRGTSRAIYFFILLGAAILFSTNASNFAARVTDISALRVLQGEVAYRDFWTIYAPGSFYVTAGAFALFGSNLIVSNLLGIIVSSLAVATYYRLVARVAPAIFSIGSACSFAVVLFNTNYYIGLSSYPPSILFLLLGAGLIADFAESGSRRRLLLAGFCFGTCALFKHDIGAYACLAGALTIAVAPLPVEYKTPAKRFTTILLLATAVILTMLPVAILFISVARKDMLQDLIVFPIRDFPWARKESFPGILPDMKWPSTLREYQLAVFWEICNFPLFVSLGSLPFLWRFKKSFTRSQAGLILFSIFAFLFFWNAAHVQINTHPNTLTAFAALLASAAGSRGGLRFRRALAVIALIWAIVLVAEPAYRLQLRVRSGLHPFGLPHLAGIRGTRSEIAWMRRLSSAMNRAAPQDRPLLVLSNRNDVVIYCQGVPYWLSNRKIITRYQELHPGVTDTWTVQQEMLRDISRGPLPVVVREYRFGNKELEKAKKRLQERLPVGATLLDDWLKNNYSSGEVFRMYQVMIPLH